MPSRLPSGWPGGARKSAVALTEAIPDLLLYSSHDRCAYLHGHWIVRRALAAENRLSVLYLPFSMRSLEQQHYSWDTFNWYFSRFTACGLSADAFFWTPHLSQADIGSFFQQIMDAEVVILGGGHPLVGLERYGAMGERMAADPCLFPELLWHRQAKKKLTVGFSAGADQLAEWCSSHSGRKAYGLAKGIMTLLHYDHSKQGRLRHVAARHPDCLVFGLPNDSGIAVSQGRLPGGWWQRLDFIIDNSWEFPADSCHIKTRQGQKIDHVYADGRYWGFNGGDAMLRLVSDRGRQLWIKQPLDDRWFDYHSQLHSREDPLRLPAFSHLRAAGESKK